jgi:hypothetical protein
MVLLMIDGVGEWMGLAFGGGGVMAVRGGKGRRYL